MLFHLLALVSFSGLIFGRPLCFGHRGYSARYPENTMLSLLKSLDLGSDGVETDLRLTKDKQIILMHDASLDRTTSGTGSVLSHTYHNDIDAMKTICGGQRIPLLSHLLNSLLFDPKYSEKMLVLDIKEDNAVEILDCLWLLFEFHRWLKWPRGQKLDFSGQIVLGVWDSSFFKRARALFPGYVVGLIHEFWPPRSTDAIAVPDDPWDGGLDFYSLDWSAISDDKIVETVHGRKRLLFSWVNNDFESAEAASRWKLDGIHTDDIEICKALF